MSKRAPNYKLSDMQSSDFQEFLDTCQRILMEKDAAREKSEAYIIAFLQNIGNFDYVKYIFEEQANNQIKLITIESLGKALLKNINLGPNDSSTIVRYRGGASEEDISVDSFEYNKLLMDYFIFFLKQTKTKSPNFIINSICDFFGNSLKYMLFNSIPVHSFMDSLKDKFFGINSSLEELYIGFKFFYFCLTDLLINSHQYGYFKFRKIALQFQSVCLYEILNTSRNVIKYLMNNLQTVTQDSIELINLGLEVYFKCLVFPFNMTYFDFTTDNNLEEITMTIFPEEYSESISDMDFYDNLFKILINKINAEMTLNTIRILARVSSSRLSILNEEMQQNYKRKIIQGFSILVANCPIDNPVYCTEIIEYALRALLVFGVHFIKRNADLQQSFEASSAFFSEAVIKLADHIDDPIFIKIVDFWNKLRSNSSDDDGKKSTTFILKCMNTYCTYYILQNNSIAFFVDNIKSHKKFRKLVNSRFDHFKEFFLQDIHATGQMMELLERLQIMEFDVSQGNLDANLYFTRLGHFILILTKTFLKMDTIYYGYQSYIDSLDEKFELVSQNHTTRVAKLCAGVFNFLQRTSSMAGLVRPEILRGFEMSILLFLETFTLNALDKQQFNEEIGMIEITDEVYKLVMNDLQLFGGFGQFFDLLTSKILGNLEYKDTVLGKFSILVLRTVIEKIKKVYKGKSQTNFLLETFTEKLFTINSSSLSEPKFYKLRSNLFETIAISYLDDNYDDYIQNSHKIFNRIIATNTYPDGTVDLMKVFYDLLGIYRAITLSKIIIIFSKISYPRVQNLLQTYGASFLTNPEFISTLLDFYAILIENTSQKYSVAQAHIIMYKILTDSCRVVSMFIKDMNQTLERIIVKEEMIKFLENNLKLVKKFLKVFKALLKFSDVSFSIFHFFGDVIFLEFIKNIHQFMFLIAEYIINYFPDKEEEFFSCFMESCTNLSDFIIEFFEPVEIEKIFKIIYIIFVKRSELILSNSETRNVYDESIIQNVHSIIVSVCTSVYEEHNINIENQQFQIKIQQIMDLSLSTIKEFSLKIIEFCHMTNYNFHLNNMISDVIFYLLCVFGSTNILSYINEKLQSHWKIHNNADARAAVVGIFNELQTSMSFKLDIINKEKFHVKFKDFIKALVKFSQEDYRLRASNFITSG
jgi:hypothetical protein